MVFFNCEKCGDAVKKNQVDKHSFQCRNAAISCMDCHKVFTLNSYKNHNKCISEDQKYGGKGFVARENKGDVKQAAWVEQVQLAITGVSDPRLRQLLERIKSYDNIPRKEKKFINFLGNSVRIFDRNLCTQAWKAIESVQNNKSTGDKLDASNGENDGASTAAQNGNSDNTTAHDAKSKENGGGGIPTSTTTQRKRKMDHGDGEVAGDKKTKTDADQQNCDDADSVSVADSGDNNNNTFKWKSTIKRLLRAAADHQMKERKLVKAAIDQYFETTESGADQCTREQLTERVKAKIEGMQNLQRDGKVIKLL